MLKDAMLQEKHYKRLALVVWLFLFFLLSKGFIFGGGNNVIFIPGIYKLANPTFLNGDWYIKALVPYHYFFNLFYAKLLVYSGVKLPLLFFFSYCVTLLLYIASLRKLSNVLFKRINPFYILLPLVVIWRTNGIENNALIHSNHFESLFLAIPIVIFAIAYFFEDKLVKSFFLLGAATFVHIQIGVCMFIVLFLCHTISNYRDPAQMVRDISVPILCYFIVSALPLVVTSRQVLDTNVAGSGNFFIDYVRFRLPHHFILSSYWESIASFTLLCFLGFIGFRSKKKEKSDDKIAVFVSVIFAGIFLQYVFIELIPVDSLAKFQFFRVSVFVSMMAFMYIANCLCDILEKEKASLAFLIVIAVICSHIYLALALVILLLYLRKSGGFSKTRSWWIFLLLLLLGFMIALSEKAGVLACPMCGYLTGKFDFYNVKYTLCALVLAGMLCILSVKNSRIGLYVLPRKCVMPLAIFSIIVLGIHAKNGVLEGNFFYNIKPYVDYDNNWKKLCLWIKENTKSKDAFITPPYLEGFLLYAERKEVVDFKSNPFLEKDIVEWKKRLEDATNIDDVFVADKKGFESLDSLKAGYNSLSERQVRALAKKYKARYIIFEKPKKLPFSVLHETKDFIIYRIPARR